MAINTILYSQNYGEYYQLVATAQTHYVNKEYKEAIEKFKIAFDKFYPFLGDVEIMKKCYLAIGDKKGAYQAQCDMVLCGYRIDDTMPVVYSGMPIALYHHQDVNLEDSLLERQFLKVYPELRNQYESHIDPELNKYMEVCVYFEIYSRIMRQQAASKSIKQMRQVQDAGFNAEKTIFMNLMREKDIPRFKVSAWDYFNTGQMLIHTAQSTTKEDYEEYFKLLWQQVERGNVHLIDYVTCFDNVYARMNKFKKCYYGKQCELKKDGKLYILPVDDIEDIDNRRAKIGLPPLWVWCKQYNLVPPAGYAMPENDFNF
jgi:tetratricopeptide (TPR) repeat protein